MKDTLLGEEQHLGFGTGSEVNKIVSFLINTGFSPFQQFSLIYVPLSIKNQNNAKSHLSSLVVQMFI